MKKLVSLILVLAMMLSLCAVSAGAEETKTLVWWTITGGDAPIDAQKVIEAANKISEEKIGVKVDLQFMTSDQLTMSLNAGEYYDLIFTCNWFNNYDENARNEYYYDITDLLADYPDLYNAIDPWWQGAVVNDRIYGIPALKDIGIQVFFRMNSDYFENEKGMTLPDEMKFEELEPYLAAWKADHPNEYPLHMTKSGLTGFWQVHQRVVSSYLVIPYEATGDAATTIIPIWEDETYMNMLRCLHKWYELGYINPDAATNESLPMELGTPVRSGTAWTGYKGWSNPETYGFNVKLVQYIGPYMSRASMQGALFAINAGASEENARASLKYFQLLYTDTAFRDILAYGIEGEHFNYLSNGTVLRTELGKSNYSFDTYCTGPVVSASVVSASESLLGEPDQWAQVYENYKKASISAIGSFSYDGTDTEDVRTALYAIYQNHFNELVTGTVDPDETFAKIAAEMYAIGLQDVIDDAQSQLDEYLANNQ